MKNKELAGIFSKIADALEIKGETGFKVIAYRKATRTLEDLTEDIEFLSKEGRLREISGIGSGIAQKIEEYIKTGHIKKFDEALSDIPSGLLELLNIQNLGSKTIHIAHKQYAVKNLEDLKRVIDDGSLAQAYGLGEKKVENIRKGIEIFEHAQERMPISEALNIAEEVIDYLRKAPHIGRISPAGSLRRMRETVGDIDILAAGKQGTQIIRHFTQFPGSTRTLVAGKTKGSIMIDVKGVERQVDLRIVDESEYGAALQYFSGSKAHNIRLRALAKEAGLKVSEYGVFKGRKKIAGFDEKEVYSALNLPVIPPELREDRGEIELALQNKLPRIVELSDIRGDLHVHSNYSDGSLSIEELAEMAKELGYEYIAVCDHSQVVRYANGLTPDRLRKQMKEIDRLNREIKGIKILKGSEVDILQDGRLDFPDEILKDLDFVVAAIHSGFMRNVTERMLKAIENPYVSTIAHPSGRLISKRKGYDVDLEEIIDKIQKREVGLELNAFYDRLDLNEFYLKRAKEKGIRISIGTDSHHPGGLGMMQFGVGIARRAWLEKKDILNCLSYEELRSLRKIRK